MGNPARDGKGKYGNQTRAGESRSVSAAGYIAKRNAERRANRGGSSVIEWAGCSAAKVIAIIDSVTHAGCTATFALTRDGSALKFSIYDGADRVDEYCRSTEEADTFLDMLLEIYG